MSNNTKFVTMGEIMLRMTRPDYQRIIQGNKIDGFMDSLVVARPT